MVRFLRYFAPNAVTSLALLFGLLSFVATHEGRFVDAGWLIIWSVLLDRVDGFVARAVRGTSSFGVQMDSFADAINFGVAPSFLVWVSLSSVPALGFDQGIGRVLLLVACGTWTLANVFRLAKFNVVSEAGPNVFFGVPTTLAAGVLGIWYLVLHKYSAPGALLGSPDAFESFKLFGNFTISITAWSYLPAAMLVGAFLMVSNLPTPKLGKLKYKSVTAVVAVSVLLGYICGFARYMPDFMALMPSTWLVVSLVWSQVSAQARGLRAPPFLPA